MVYRGKPSTACKLCRQRRIKCDRRRPACSQCLNVHAICGGYRDELDLMFRHETDTVTRKARAQSPQSLSFSSDVEGGPESQRVPVCQVLQELIPSPRMQLLIEPASARAINMFFCSYSDGLYLEYLPGLYMSRDRPTSIGASFEAAALAYMANDQRRDDMQRLSHERYGHALSLTTAALQSPQTMATPETIASVLLLALFAAISMESSQEAAEVWSKHVRGAMAILASCPPSLFYNAPGQSLLHHIIGAMQMDYLNRCLPPPPELNTLYSVSWLNQGPQAQFWSMYERLAELNASFDESRVTPSDLESLRDADSDLQYLLVIMPRTYRGAFDFQADTELTQRTSSDMQDFSSIPNHTFKSHRIAQAWNCLRMMRLKVATMLVSGASSYISSTSPVSEVPETIQAWRSEASANARQTIIDVCSTVPATLRPGQWRGDLNQRFQYSAWARSLIFPLTVAREAPHGSEELDGYLKEQLRIVGAITGMRSVHQETSGFQSTLKNWYESGFTPLTSMDEC
ncbi:uncharacterized protein N7459_008558 [Penicillium hispanicum]|uniref:uncharacterized protein n=1 Tax=Penicillium hispanicum TaxID=1080232 RepID=UPI0025406457|nr:uncharacterized protein N7459_008558 [Penicillium hispanicum]KAJ5574131.1 hypothetical protein N7459_008558 [Penicillium hispanicum]